MSDHLWVSMPTYDTPAPLLDRAVRGVLGSEHRDLTLVIVNDGGSPLGPLPDDDRIVTHRLPRNRGRYFADAVALEAVQQVTGGIGWFAVHDADDWIEPGQYPRLLTAAADTGATVAPYWRYDVDREPRLQQPAGMIARADRLGGLRHIAHWATGVYRLDRMAAAGGIRPDVRVGFDTLHTLLLRLTGPLSVCDTPGYHWERRRGSLSLHPTTRQGSVARTQARAVLQRILRDAEVAARAGRSVADVVRSSVAPGIWHLVDEQVDRLAGRL